MDKTDLVREVAQLLTLADHDVQTSVRIAFREIDVVAHERVGLSRKTILIECADYKAPVGVAKVQEDLGKLRAAQNEYEYSSVIMHVSRSGYTPDAAGFGEAHRADLLTLDQLTSRLMNFDGYVAAIETEPLRPIILSEYQPTRLHADGNRKDGGPAVAYLREWLTLDKPWMTVLGDYGVGKSWMLKRLLYDLIEDYKRNPLTCPLPLFVPLQLFNKAIDFETLVTATLQHSGVGTVNYRAFEYLASVGRVIFLLDSFDEMAQTIRPDIIRENLAALLIGVANGSKAIMTSRPTYFESRAERLLVIEKDGHLQWEPIDILESSRRTAVAELLASRLSSSKYSRLNDLTHGQRLRLFKSVLGDKPEAYRTLEDLYKRFQSLEGVSQRAVIARLMTTVAETIAEQGALTTPDGYPLLPAHVENINESKVFQIVVNNLLFRDLNFGGLRAADRHRFLRSLAIMLQRPGRSTFATPTEIRSLVGSLFAREIATSDTPHGLLDNYYRTCRRHSGLTTQGQFLDTSGAIDVPIEAEDVESPVGFSHNSLREFLVADALADALQHGTDYPNLQHVRVSDAVASFFVGLSEYSPTLTNILRDRYARCDEGQEREWLFKLILGFLRSSPALGVAALGQPPKLSSLDLAGVDLSKVPLNRALITESLLLETDLRSADIRYAAFTGSVLERVQFDGARLDGADFRGADIISVYVYDRFTRNTTAVLTGRDARQWLYSSGALVADSESLNPYLGQGWYEASREISRTLVARLAGTHQSGGLVKGTDLSLRPFATEFRDFLLSRGLLEVVKKAPGTGNVVVRVAPSARNTMSAFSERGEIHEPLDEFFGPLVAARRGTGNMSREHRESSR